MPYERMDFIKNEKLLHFLCPPIVLFLSLPVAPSTRFIPFNTAFSHISDSVSKLPPEVFFPFLNLFQAFLLFLTARNQ